MCPVSYSNFLLQIFADPFLHWRIRFPPFVDHRNVQRYVETFVETGTWRSCFSRKYSQQKARHQNDINCNRHLRIVVATNSPRFGVEVQQFLLFYFLIFVFWENKIFDVECRYLVRQQKPYFRSNFSFPRYIILFVGFLTNVAEFIKQKSFYFEYIIEGLLQFTCTICKMSILQLGTRYQILRVVFLFCLRW